MKRLVAGVALLLVACGTKPPLLLPPDRVDSFCSEKEPRGTAIASILASATDALVRDVAYPGDAMLRTDVKQNTGIIGHWDAQPLYLPKVAAAIGVDGDYLDVKTIVIDNQISGTDSRLIYVTVSTPRGPKNLVLRAYDIQNVCVEGTRLS
jgi:predicted small lipoprotein YifL